MSATFYDVNGEFIGPKYWSSELYLDDAAQYVVDHMKHDCPMYEEYIELGPELPEELPSERSYKSTDRFLDRISLIQAETKTDTLSPVLAVRRWDYDCNALVSVYRTKRYCHYMYLGLLPA